MKTFIIGPVQMYRETRDIYRDDYIYFRNPKFSEFEKDAIKRLNRLLNAPEKSSTFFLGSSGTGAMEAVVENCTKGSDRVLLINGGTFGKRFGELLRHHSIPYEEILVDFDSDLKEEDLAPYEGKGFTHLFVNIDETSIGKLYDMQMISDFCRRNGLYLIVDAISSFLADEYDVSKYSIDATVISSQKGLCLNPGMAIVNLSERMAERVKENDSVSTLYFDFKDYLRDAERGQTPYTPPVGIINELRAIEDLIDNGGGYLLGLTA